MSGVLAVKRHSGPEKATQLLNEAVELHFKGLKVNTLFLLPFYQIDDKYYFHQYVH